MQRFGKKKQGNVYRSISKISFVSFKITLKCRPTKMFNDLTNSYIRDYNNFIKSGFSCGFRK